MPDLLCNSAKKPLAAFSLPVSFSASASKPTPTSVSQLPCSRGVDATLVDRTRRSSTRGERPLLSGERARPSARRRPHRPEERSFRAADLGRHHPRDDRESVVQVPGNTRTRSQATYSSTIWRAVRVAPSAPEPSERSRSEQGRLQDHLPQRQDLRWLRPGRHAHQLRQRQQDARRGRLHPRAAARLHDPKGDSWGV
jgi:hypothetical protein